MRDLPKYWDQYYGGLHKPEFEVETGLSTEELAALRALEYVKKLKCARAASI